MTATIATPNGPQPASDAPAPDIYAATSLADIHAGLAQLHHREATVTQRLNALITSQKDLSRELARLDREPHLGRREAPRPGAVERQGDAGRGRAGR
jgi:hypothetical protein